MLGLAFSQYIAVSWNYVRVRACGELLDNMYVPVDGDERGCIDDENNNVRVG